MSEGRKDDADKLRYDLEPQDARAGMIGVLTDGAVKYGARNWEAGMDWSRVYAAHERHMSAWWAGETHDPDTGRSHLDHAMCCVAFLSAYEKRGVGTDDRPTTLSAEMDEIRRQGPTGPILRVDDGCKAYQVRQGHPPGMLPEPRYGCPKCGEEWVGENETLPCKRQSDDGWIDHDGSDRCPVDPTIRLDTKGVEGPATFNFHAAPASGIDWPGVGKWRVSEVDGWRRWPGQNGPKSQPFDKCKVVYRDGKVSGPHFAGNMIWMHTGNVSDIVAYKIVEIPDGGYTIA